MSVCVKLMKGFDLECEGAEYRKYYQNAVLINRSDVENFTINSGIETNNIIFNLLATKTGYLFRSTENSSSIKLEFSKSEKKGIVYYDHKMDLPIIGVTENSKTILKQLDMSDYFGAIQFKDGTIEIVGFNYGLKTSNYTYDPAGTVISLESKYSEYDPPYVYGGDASDFDNLFADIPNINVGDFNNDFNNDFYISN